MKKIPKILYKYVASERVDVLEHLKIRFTQADELNDPYECAPTFSEVYPSDALATARRPPPGHGLINFHPGPKDNSFDKFTPTQRAYINKTLVDAMQAVFKSVYLILSLSDTHDSLPMWAHYTSNHQGLVIGFDAQHQFFLGNKWTSGALDLAAVNKVKYTRQRARFKFATEIDKTAAFFTKSLEWQYEREWRMIKQVEEEDEVIHNGINSIYLFAIPPDAVRCVILGAASSEETGNRVKAAIQDNPELNHVQILKAKVAERSFKLLIEDLV